MRFSKSLISTSKETPNDATLASHIYLLRGGFIQNVGGSGLYNFMPLGKRVLDNIQNIVKQELDNVGCQEVSLSFVTPSSLWEESGRLNKFGKELLRFKDRKNNDFVLGPTHEEMMVNMVRGSVKSYKQLPLNVYQVNLKFRDEVRPRFGIMRSREFLMKDAYSFHSSIEDMEREFALMEETYKKIFNRLELDYRVVEADSGAIGGSGSKEFMVLADSGEDTIVVCDSCDYAANIEAASAKKDIIKDSREVKSVIYKAIFENDENRYVNFIIPGNFEFQEVKCRNAVGAIDLEEVENVVIVDMIVADESLEKTDILSNVAVSKYADLTAVAEGNVCNCCGGVLSFKKGIEVGHIFQLGTKYSETMGANFLDENGKSKPMVMGTYGIGVSRLIAAIIEQKHDDRGCVWPSEASPFDLHIIISNVKEDTQVAWAEKIYNDLTKRGVSVLIDDRKDKFGVKINDYELIGSRRAIVIGKKLLEDKIEFICRDGLDKKDIPTDIILDFLNDHF